MILLFSNRKTGSCRLGLGPDFWPLSLVRKRQRPQARKADKHGHSVVLVGVLTSSAGSFLTTTKMSILEKFLNPTFMFL